METNRITIKGLCRNRARSEFPDGECQEIINMRFRDNAWRPIPGKEKMYNTLDTTYTAIYHHVQDNVDNYIGYVLSTGQLLQINMALGSGTLIHQYTAGVTVQVQFLKSFLLVIQAAGIDKYLYVDGEYKLMNIAYPPAGISLVASASHTEITDSATTAEGLLGNYTKSLIEASANWGHLTGGIMYRLAYRLYDGTYVMHTIPYYLQIAPLGGLIRKVSTGVWRMEYFNAYLYLSIASSWFVGFADMKDIISSVAVFACRNEPLYQIDEFALTDSVLTGVTTTKYFQTSSYTIFNLNDNFKKMADSAGWYKIHEIPFLQLSTGNIGDTEALDLKGFYLDYTSRETMPVDNFSYHSLMSITSFEYNDRLLLGDVTTFFGNHTQHSLLGVYSGTEYTLESSTRLSYLLFVLSTDAGIIYKLQAITGNYLTRLSDGHLCTMFDNSVIGYPDSRCTEIRLITQDSGKYYLTHTFTMSKSAHDNYAYYHSQTFSGDNAIISNGINNFPLIVVEIDFLSANEVNLEVYENSGSYRDQNRVQVSELRNPYYFPAKNSYQIGSGHVIGMGTNTEPISEGQFGQYPLYVFTTKGIYMLQQGSGDVVYASVAPVSGEVADGTQFVSVGTGVVFSCDRGLYLISGKGAIRLSQAIEGPILTTYKSNNHFAYFVNHPSLVELTNQISSVDFLDYVDAAIIGFDKTNNELVVTNNYYNYSYVFNFESNTWHKIGTSYSLFIQNYPFLYAIDTEGVKNLSSETGTSEVSVLIATQPLNLSLPEVYKKVERMVLRCLVETKLACSITFAIWATDDIKTFQFITGGQRTGEIQNILLTRSHNSAKFYIASIFGQITPESSIDAVDYSVTPRLNRKLRT